MAKVYHVEPTITKTLEGWTLPALFLIETEEETLLGDGVLVCESKAVAEKVVKRFRTDISPLDEDELNLLVEEARVQGKLIQ